MKYSKYIFFTFILIALAACSLETDNNWSTYEEWREANDEWMAEKAELLDEDGKLYYTRVQAAWDDAESSYVLMKYFNDTTLTENNLKPLYTSTVDVKYIGRTYEDEAVDSSYLLTEPADSVLRTTVSGVVGGWMIALQNMHIGDSCEVLIPYQQAYGSDGIGDILPYSALQFHMKLVDIPGYVIEVED
ncbi:MAG: FKBP-type peptidyl-prolyl cis-trans isomerase [Bacteroidales bacterium]